MLHRKQSQLKAAIRASIISLERTHYTTHSVTSEHLPHISWRCWPDLHKEEQFVCYLLRKQHRGLYLSNGPVTAAAYELSKLQEYLRGVADFGFSLRHKLLVLVECRKGEVVHIERLPDAMQRWGYTLPYNLRTGQESRLCRQGWSSEGIEVLLWQLVLIVCDIEVLMWHLILIVCDIVALYS